MGEVRLNPYFRKAARFEYDEAADWYEEQRAGLGQEFVFEVARALARACEAPLQFPLVLRDIRRARVQRFPYSIFFRLRTGQLIVLAVFHARRDPRIWRART